MACPQRGDAVPVRLPAETPVFEIPGGSLVKAFDRDLRAAGIPKRDDRGRTVDLHALRHTFCTWLNRGGLPLRTAQAAMRHSDPKLTMNTYTDPAFLDVSGALAVLPDLRIRPKQDSVQAVRNALAPTLAPTPVKPCLPESFPDKGRLPRYNRGHSNNVGVSVVADKSWQRVASVGTR